MATALIATLLVALYLWWWQPAEPIVAAEPVAQAATVSDKPPMPAAAAISHALDPEPAAEPLPYLDGSDLPLGEALSAVVGAKPWKALFNPERVIRRIVATVDNLPRQQAPVKMWPVRPTGAWFETAASGDVLTVSPSNSRRYAAYVGLVQTVEVVKLVAIYRHFYPLFQQAYVDLGYPKGYFNDRLVVAIDDLLAAPELVESPQLVQRKVLYEYADTDLEGRSAGQKIMLRIGSGNARIVKARLREFRSAVATSPK
ncbi:MAG: DUF3014 domain-containing protein [Gammaproteobacteria bacterium]|nr:DUF3014 domain-containing protein [Gammaproteobacteria bacterium]MBU1644744.1 DUF3014 domain-containing protein [Gammaproteobacteria bacterium]MBU1973478.1 DUF3014 domain-containing protein [Gammaproteobacteria bacterium]